MSDRGVRLSLLRSGQLSQSARLGVTTYNLQLRKVRTPIWVFLDYMESPLSQEFIHMPEEDRICQTEESNLVYRGQVSSVSQLGWA